MKKEVNQKDYAYSARFTKGKLVTFFQDKGARVHFNYTTINDPTLEKMTHGKKNQIGLRYGVV
jgi:hypothetical protein